MGAESRRDTGPSDRGFDLADRVERDAQADRDWERGADKAVRHTPAPEPPAVSYLDAAAYDEVRMRAVAASTVIANLGVDELEALISEPLSAPRPSGPAVDPTLYRDGAAALAREIRVFRSLLTFRRALEGAIE